MTEIELRKINNRKNIANKLLHSEIESKQLNQEEIEYIKLSIRRSLAIDIIQEGMYLKGEIV